MQTVGGRAGPDDLEIGTTKGKRYGVRQHKILSLRLKYKTSKFKYSVEAYYLRRVSSWAVPKRGGE